MELVTILHALCLLVLSAYALHQGVLLILYWRARRIQPTQPTDPQSITPNANIANPDLPIVTIQLPLYNERHMAERVIAAAAKQSYPRDRLHIQVLDDSTDDTTQIAQAAVQRAQKQGVNIDLIHRTNRSGYKAGALESALPSARGDFIAIFDADFVPDPDFLCRMIQRERVFDDPKVGFAQTRWDYLNRDASPLTRAQAMTLDMHFVIEQPARSTSGLLMNFNGSGGIWRRECIRDAGGWQSDTLTEDLDLSYRAGLRGWRGVYVPDQPAPSELPADVLAYKRQQARWARGTLQTVRKIMPRVARAQLPLHKKIAAWMHLTGYFIHPLILVMTITTPLLILRSLIAPMLSEGVGAGSVPVWVNAVSVISFAPIVSMAVAHQVRRRPFVWFLRDLPASLMLGIGISFSNTMGMLSAMFDRKTGEWQPTPKSPEAAPPSAQTAHSAKKRANSSAINKRTAPKRKRMRPDWTMWIELGLAVYAAIALFVVVQAGLWMSVAPMFLYVLGFGGVWLNQVVSAFDDEQKRH